MGLRRELTDREWDLLGRWAYEALCWFDDFDSNDRLSAKCPTVHAAIVDPPELSSGEDRGTFNTSVLKHAWENHLEYVARNAGREFPSALGALDDQVVKLADDTGGDGATSSLRTIFK